MKRAGLAVVVALASVVAVSAQNERRVVQKVLVKVNGEVFMQTHLERLQLDELKQRKRTITDPQQLQNDAGIRAIIEEITPDILLEAVDNLMLVQHGRELGIHLSEERFKGIVDQFKKDYKLDDASLKVALAQEGLSFETWRELIEQQSIVSDVQREEIMQKASVTEEEKKQYYAAHPDEFKTAATITLRDILVPAATVMQAGKPAVSAAAQEEAKTKADAVVDRLRKGEDFLKLVGEVSESGTKANGGLLGTFNLGDLEPALGAIIGKLKPGEISDPVPTQRGYQIFKLDGTTQPELQPFEKVKDQITQKIYSNRMDAETRKFLDRIRTMAIIEWKDEGLKKMYEKRLAERTAAAK